MSNYSFKPAPGGFYRVKTTTNCQNVTRVSVLSYALNPITGGEHRLPDDSFEIAGGSNSQGVLISKGGGSIPPVRHELIVETRRTDQSVWHNLFDYPKSWRTLIDDDNQVLIGFEDWTPFGPAGNAFQNILVTIEFSATPYP
jgi:hypothetical protein